jgi:intein-encoded DNA endonuclease-like protein
MKLYTVIQYYSGGENTADCAGIFKTKKEAIEYIMSNYATSGIIEKDGNIVDEFGEEGCSTIIKPNTSFKEIRKTISKQFGEAISSNSILHWQEIELSL